MTVGGIRKKKRWKSVEREREKVMRDGRCLCVYKFSLFFFFFGGVCVESRKANLPSFGISFHRRRSLLFLSGLLLSAFNSVRSVVPPTHRKKEKKKPKLLLNLPRYWIQVASQLPVFSLPYFSFVCLVPLFFFVLSLLLLFFKNKNILFSRRRIFVFWDFIFPGVRTCCVCAAWQWEEGKNILGVRPSFSRFFFQQ